MLSRRQKIRAWLRGTGSSPAVKIVQIIPPSQYLCAHCKVQVVNFGAICNETNFFLSILPGSQWTAGRTYRPYKAGGVFEYERAWRVLLECGRVCRLCRLLVCLVMRQRYGDMCDWDGDYDGVAEELLAGLDEDYPPGEDGNGNGAGVGRKEVGLSLLLAGTMDTRWEREVLFDSVPGVGVEWGDDMRRVPFPERWFVEASRAVRAFRPDLGWVLEEWKKTSRYYACEVSLQTQLRSRGVKASSRFDCVYVCESQDSPDALYLKVFLYAPRATIASNHLVRYHAPEYAGSVNNFEMIRNWITLCDSSHTKCNRHATTIVTPLPTRVIDVGTNNPSGDPRLIDTNGLCGRYICLSHRWASALPLKTTTAHLAKLKKRIPFSLLSKTFQDAVTATRQLGERYLWIDSLCIVQDDAEDWKRESAMMGAVFSNAFLTIAAVDSIVQEGSSDVVKDRGLFMNEHDDGPPLAVSLNCEDATGQAGDFVYMAPEVPGFEEMVEKSMWNKRGWVIQERILSTRIVYYTSQQIFWECGEARYDETGKMAVEPARLSIGRGQGDGGPTEAESPGNMEDSEPGSVSRHTLQQCDLWWRLVEFYSERLLTVETDRYVAVSGMCKELEQHFSITHWRGLIESAIECSLFWQASDEKPLHAIPDMHAPSWSWTSVMGGVVWPLPFRNHRAEAVRARKQGYDPLNRTVVSCVTDIRFSGPQALTDNKTIHDELSFTTWISIAARSGISFAEIDSKQKEHGYAEFAPWNLFKRFSRSKNEAELLYQEFMDYRHYPRVELVRDFFDNVIGWVSLDGDDIEQDISAEDRGKSIESSRGFRRLDSYLRLGGTGQEALSGLDEEWAQSREKVPFGKEALMVRDWLARGEEFKREQAFVCAAIFERREDHVVSFLALVPFGTKADGTVVYKRIGCGTMIAERWFERGLGCRRCEVVIG